MLRIIPLGGLGEIGLNIMAFEYQDVTFIVDAGLMFPEGHMLGIDYVIPDMSYLKRQRNNVAAIVLTHAHEDHIGALPYLLKELNIPVFATPFTLGMVRHRLAEYPSINPVGLHEIHPGESLKLGAFELEFIRVSHSVVDGIGLAIQTPVGLVVHTGDFKIGHNTKDGLMTDVGRFAQCGRQGVLALLSDSTNVEKEGYTVSDQEVGEAIEKTAAKSTGRIIVALFASSISRIQQVINICAAQNRKLIVNGRSIENSIALAASLGYLNIPADMEIDVQQVGDYADDELLILTTGSQGEPMAALARMATGNHKFIDIKPGDTVILSSKFIPGNERAITGIINHLYRRGANVVYEKISGIHVSGHAFREELKLMISLTRPKYFIPIHGEYRHLMLHGRLAEGVGVPPERVLLAENGQVICFDGNGGRIDDTVETGRVLIDGKGVGDVGRSVLKERRILSEDGLVVVNMAFDEETGIIVYGPEIVSRGFVFENITGHLLEDAKCVILEIVDEIAPDTPLRIDKIRERTKTALRKYFSFTIRRRPVILPFILEI
jgi:ribonuclease J